MPPSRCPACGGTERRPIAPGWFVCTSTRIVDVVPTGMQGNLADVPISGVCGHRYQAGAMTSPLCFCGVFSVGTCRQCGQALCGDHGTQAGGSFVCVQHVVEARQRALDENAARNATATRERRELERRMAQERAELIARELPGFPERELTGRELAELLADLVPERTQRLVVRRVLTYIPLWIDGWMLKTPRHAFLLARGGASYHEHVTLGTQPPREVRPHSPKLVRTKPSEIFSEEAVLAVRDLVLRWRTERDDGEAGNPA